MACQPVEMFDLAALLVGRHEHVGGDLGHAGGVVDDAGGGVALDVVDVGLVERPGVDLALRPVVGVVDRAIVEAEGLGGPVQDTGVEPGLLGGREGVVGGVGDEGVDGRLQRLGRRGHVGVGREDEVGVGRGGREGGLVGEPALGRRGPWWWSSAASSPSSPEQAAPRREPARRTAASRRGSRCASRRFSRGRTGHPIELGRPYSSITCVLDASRQPACWRPRPRPGRRQLPGGRAHRPRAGRAAERGADRRLRLDRLALRRADPPVLLPGLRVGAAARPPSRCRLVLVAARPGLAGPGAGLAHPG